MVGSGQANTYRRKALTHGNTNSRTTEARWLASFHLIIIIIIVGYVIKYSL